MEIPNWIELCKGQIKADAILHDVFPLSTASDLARRWGVTPAVVDNWRKRHEAFPRPFLTVNDGKTGLYAECDVKLYEAERGLRK